MRDWYSLDGGRKLFVTTDRLSAFDRVLARVPYKGQVLNQLAACWFDATPRPDRQRRPCDARSERGRDARGQALPGGSDRARLHHRRDVHGAVVPLLARRARDLRLHASPTG